MRRLYSSSAKTLKSVWARTRNWNAEWTKGAAGRFRIDINMNALSSRRSAKDVWRSDDLGADDGKDWHWQKAGVLSLKNQTVCAISLRDLTGFNGRCDALYFTTEGDCPPAGGAEPGCGGHL